MGRAKEHMWSKELGCQAAIKFHSTACSDMRVNVIFSVIVGLAFFLSVAQLFPYRVIDPRKFWCSDAVDHVSVVSQSHHALPESLLHEKVNTSTIDLSHGEVRIFRPHGMAAHLFIEMGTYRGGPRSFSVVGLASKPVEYLHQPPYECEWVSTNPKNSVVKGAVNRILPDWNYGRLYTVVVLTCNFSEDVGTDRTGGELILYASYGDEYRKPERIVALTEVPGEYNATMFAPPYPYDYVYCGSSVYGDVSPQRMREWIAYHAYVLGNRSHFILHDSGGFHDDVRKVLEPWIRKGRVTIQNVRQQEIYDGYYHNQFLIVNDCLFRSRFLAEWTFFFDVDEYLYVPPTTSLSDVLSETENVTQITFEQVPISNQLCMLDNTTKSQRKWGFEKLVFRQVLKRGVRYDRKYVLKARHAEATGVHMSMNMKKGKNEYVKGNKIRYYHYHDTINTRREVCREFVEPQNKTNPIKLGKAYHRIDESMLPLVNTVKQFELATIGHQPHIL